MDFTICIVTYNNQEKIGPVVQGIAANISGRFSYKLFVVDNCSTDNTVQVVADLNAGAEIICNPNNVGFGRAHNQVIANTPAQYHFIINPDIFVHGNVFERMFDFLEQHPDVGLATAGVRYPDGSIQHHGKRNPKFIDLSIRLFAPKHFNKRQTRYTMSDRDFSQVFDVEVASGCFLCGRTSLLREIGGFDPRFFLYFEDADLSRKAKKRTRVVHFPADDVMHEWNRHSRKRFKIKMVMIISAFKYLFKWSLGGIFAGKPKELFPNG